MAGGNMNDRELPGTSHERTDPPDDEEYSVPTTMNDDSKATKSDGTECRCAGYSSVMDAYGTSKSGDPGYCAKCKPGCRCGGRNCGVA